jgi:hypothetical protein
MKSKKGEKKPPETVQVKKKKKTKEDTSKLKQ